jgi:hypothetical protein
VAVALGVGEAVAVGVAEAVAVAVGVGVGVAVGAGVALGVAEATGDRVGSAPAAGRSRLGPVSSPALMRAIPATPASSAATMSDTSRKVLLSMKVGIRRA